MDDRMEKKGVPTSPKKQEIAQGRDVAISLADAGGLPQILQAMSDKVEQHYQNLAPRFQNSGQNVAGTLIGDLLQGVYQDFRPYLPYQRLGLALLEAGGKTVRLCWLKTERQPVLLEVGYCAEMAGSSLAQVLTRRESRILSDLVAYLAKNPASVSTRLMVDEGYRSSLTCPLVSNGMAVGFLFFSSPHLNAYTSEQARLLDTIAGWLTQIVEKTCLVAGLADCRRQLERQNAEMQRLLHLKEFFLGKAVHDLRNPIANLQLTSDVLMGDGGQPLSPDELQGFVKDLNQQARYLSDLIGDIMSVAEIEIAPVQGAQVDFEVAPFLQEAVRRAQKLADPKRIRVEIEPELAGKAHGDPQRLRQALDQLLSNAIKYSPLGSQVRVYALPVAAGWRFSVRDQGPGILEKDRPRLFSDFGRLSTRSTAGERSTGLGLAIARRLVEAQAGQIGVEPAPDLGSIFWFEIP